MLKQRLFLALPLICLLIFLIIQSFNQGMSSIFYTNFSYFISAPVSNEKLKEAESLLEASNAYSAGNPHYYLLKGSVKSLQSYIAEQVDENDTKPWNEVTEDYAQAVLLQADNPFAWMGLSQSYYYQHKTNNLDYLNRSIKYGRSNQSVLLNYFYFSLIDWDKMGTEVRGNAVNLLQETILANDFSLNTSGKRLNDILSGYEIKSEVCNKMLPSNKIQVFCNKKYNNE